MVAYSTIVAVHGVSEVTISQDYISKSKDSYDLLEIIYLIFDNLFMTVTAYVLKVLNIEKSSFDLITCQCYFFVISLSK